MRNVENALQWCKDESKNPSQNWHNLCQSMSRKAYGMPAYGGTAREAWYNVSKKYRTDCPDPNDKAWWRSVPSGAIIYSSGGGSPSAGHAWVCADAGESAWSVDYKRSGKIDKVEIDIPKWSSIKKYTVGYITGAQYYDKNDHWFKGLTYDKWDHYTPPFESVLAALDDQALANSAVWRLTCRLHDISFGKSDPERYTQTWPNKNYGLYSEDRGTDPNAYTEANHLDIFG